jgi:glycine/D-amino acid oxidase-like deaminating enzyme
LGKGQADVAVVGAGVFGAFTALALQERGHHVLSLDQYGPVSPRASSSGETRSIRSGYGDQAFYSAWSARGLAKWRLREAEFGRKLLYPSARIEMTDHWTDGMIAQRKIFDDLKLPYEIAQRDELRRRFPQMAFDDVDFAFVETSTSSVLVKAREAVLATIEHFEKKGGQSRFARAVPGEAQGAVCCRSNSMAAIPSRRAAMSLPWPMGGQIAARDRPPARQCLAQRISLLRHARR